MDGSQLWPPPAAELAFVARILHSSLTGDAAAAPPPLLPLELLRGDPGARAGRRHTPVKSGARDAGLLALDHECQMLLALLLRDTVLPWYSKLTPDRQLLSEIHRILSEVIRSFTLDLQSGAPDGSQPQLQHFLATELPELLEQHFVVYRLARRRVYLSSAAEPTEEDKAALAAAFAQLSPHTAVDAAQALDGRASALYLRTLTEALLRRLLPAEDQTSDAELYIVRDVFVGVLRTVIGKVSRPWFIVQTINRSLDAAGHLDWDVDRRRVVRSRTDAKPEEPAIENVGHIARILRLLELIFLTIVPHLVRFYLGFFDVGLLATRKADRNRAGHVKSLELELESTIPGFVDDAQHERAREKSASHGLAPVEPSQPILPTPGTIAESKHPELAKPASPNSSDAGGFLLRYMSFARTALHLDRRPLFQAIASLATTAFALSTGITERTIIGYTTKYLRDTTRLALQVRQIRIAAFPDGHLPPGAPDPTDAQQAREWDRLRHRLFHMLPPSARLVLFSPKSDTAAQVEEVSRILEPICSPVAAGPQTHLALILLERVAAIVDPRLLAHSHHTPLTH